MKGILLSLGILIPTILPSQIRLVPFPGIFSTYIGAHLSKRQFCLRPLSRGLFFNSADIDAMKKQLDAFSSPFSGTFFQFENAYVDHTDLNEFSSPFLGTFFQFSLVTKGMLQLRQMFSSPFSGTFFNRTRKEWDMKLAICCFRPLSRGLFFNLLPKPIIPLFLALFSSPFSGTFFQWGNSKWIFTS